MFVKIKNIISKVDRFLFKKFGSEKNIKSLENLKEAKIIFDCVLDSFSELLLADDNMSRIELRNFGVFDVRITKERTNARNPKTKENVIIPKRKKIVFKASKKIRTQLNHRFLN